MKKRIIVWSAFLSILVVILFGSCTDNPVNNGPDLPNLIIGVDSIHVAAPYGGPSPYSQFITVTSDRGNAVDYSFSESSNWMVLSNSTGALEGTTPDSFFVTFRVVFPYMLDFGSYLDTIFITSDSAANSPQHVIVKLDIGSNLAVEPQLFYYVTALNGVNPEDSIFTVASNTDEQLDYTIEENAGWISVSKTSGQTVDADSITVSIDISGLTDGLYVDTIKVMADNVFNSPQNVVCSLLVSPWQVQESPLLSANLLDIEMVNQNNGWIAGFLSDFQSRSGLLYHTTDGGQNWEINLYADTLFGFDSTLLGVVQFVSDTGWVIGENGIILNSFNNGQNWNVVDHGQGSAPIDLYDLHFITSDTGIIVGSNSLILRTTDAGANWSVISSPVNNSFRSVYFVDNMNGWICGSSAIIVTHDGGLTWESQTIPTNPDLGLSYNFTDLFFIDQNNGWATGSLGYMVHTSNGGLSWNYSKFDDAINLSAVSFSDANNGYVCGRNGTLYRTTNGGASWILQITGTNVWLNDVNFVDQNYGWVVGADGKILHTKSGGN